MIQTDVASDDMLVFDRGNITIIIFQLLIHQTNQTLKTIDFYILDLLSIVVTYCQLLRL